MEMLGLLLSIRSTLYNLTSTWLRRSGLHIACDRIVWHSF